MQYYGLDLVEELETRPHRTMSLLRQLPPGSRLARSFTKDQEWGMTEELLAVNAELTHASIRAIAALGGKKNAKRIKPWRVERPWEVRTGPRRLQGDETVAVLGAILGRGSYG